MKRVLRGTILLKGQFFKFRITVNAPKEATLGIISDLEKHLQQKQRDFQCVITPLKAEK